VKILTISHTLIVLKIKVMMTVQMYVRQNLAIYQLGYELNI
jgi:hypothetical protein